MAARPPVTPGAVTAGAVLRDTFPAAQSEADGATWLPLIVPADVAGAVMAARLVEQIGKVVSALREATTTP